jgi:hypothetical protein
LACIGRNLGALHPQLRVGVVRAELRGPLEHLLGAVGVAAPEQHLAEPPIDAGVPWGDLARRDEHGLRLLEALRLEVHPGRGDEDGDVVGLVPDGHLADQLDDRIPPGATERVAERQRRRRVLRVLLPPGVQLFDRVCHRGFPGSILTGSRAFRGKNATPCAPRKSPGFCPLPLARESSRQTWWALHGSGR